MSVIKSPSIARWFNEGLQQTELRSFGLSNPTEKQYKMSSKDRKECQMAQNITDKGNKPEKKFRAGGITATIWKNTLKDGDRSFDVRSVNLERSYKDKEGNWQNTNSMRSSDLPRAILMLQKAYEYCTIASEDD